MRVGASGPPGATLGATNTFTAQQVFNKELFIGSGASADSHVSLAGQAAYSDSTNHNMAWMLGIDSANNVGSTGSPYGDFFLGFTPSDGNFSDSIYGRRDPRSLGRANGTATWGIGVVGSSLDATPAMLTIGHSSKTGHAADHCLLILTRSSTVPIQTGYALAIQRDDGTNITYIDKDGNLFVGQSTAPKAGLTVGGVSVLTGEARGTVEVYARYGTSFQVLAGATSGNKAGLEFGQDTTCNLYKNNTGVLKTDSTFVVAGSLNPNGSMSFGDGSNISFQTATGSRIGTGSTQKLAFWNATPIVQQVLATGAAHTVDDVITLLQTIGLCKQS